jgi:predicted Ser/Thr protein kinase
VVHLLGAGGVAGAADAGGDARAGYYPKFNERALLRGSMKDQAEFLSKLSGAGGAPQIIEQNEARGWLDLPEHADGGGLAKGSQGGQANAATGQD